MSSQLRRKPVQREYLYYSRSGAPYKGASSTPSPNEKARFAMKLEVVKHFKLSDGAVRLYAILDDLSGYKGESWPSQTTLAADLGGVSTREVRRRIEELAAAGYVRMVRKQRSCRYILGWVPDRTARSTQDNSAILIGPPGPPDRTTWSDEGAFTYLTEPSIEPSTLKCKKCEDTGRIGGFAGEICDCSEGDGIRARLWTRKLRA